jgi:hypothetical protein
MAVLDPEQAIAVLIDILEACWPPFWRGDPACD